MSEISRRGILKKAALLGAAVPPPAAQKLRIVVAGGHPGDPEYGCGGTVARYTALGHEAFLLYLNRGERGIPLKTLAEAGAIRTAEAQKACEILKAHPIFAGQTDGDAVIDNPHYEDFHSLLAGLQPGLVLTHWPIDNHPDHRAISNLVYESWLRMNRSFALYYYEVSDGEDTQQFSPTHYVDIAEVSGRKRAACYAHASQEPDRYYQLQDQVARFRGLESGHAQAEAFIRQVRGADIQLPMP
jgi:LmbE family N-acetylglucosaminyl deacetylase